ncbi:hypothetical protein, partial [Arsenicibacter rosenii]|uniref:hypothetical protein n=1 Tax=Arsenicibacter rosenii TaxID=1750698 RepID=UPI0011608800
MDTLSERWNKSTSIVTGFAVSIGEKLAPYVKSAIDLFISWSDNLDVNAGVVNTLWGALGELWDVFKTLITLAFPGLSSGGTTMRGV